MNITTNRLNFTPGHIIPPVEFNPLSWQIGKVEGSVTLALFLSR